MAFTCPECSRTSHNPTDEEHGWCAACCAFTGEAAFVLRDREPLLVFMGLTSYLVMRFGMGLEPLSVDADVRALAARLERHIEQRLRRL